MIKNIPNRTNGRCELSRGVIEHRAPWGGPPIEEAKKRGAEIAFAHEAIKK
jgi:hypothetical protein